MMTTSHLHTYSAKFLTPGSEDEFTEDDVSNGLNELDKFLSGLIVPDRTFVMFESSLTKDERKFEHFRNLLGMLDEQCDVPDFDIIQFRGMRSYDMQSDLKRNMAANSLTVYQPVYGCAGFDLTFQFSAFSARLLRKVIKKILQTETLPYITSTEIIPLAYRFSKGLVPYWIDYDEEEIEGFTIPTSIREEIREFHRPLLGGMSDYLIEEFASCNLL